MNKSKSNIIERLYSDYFNELVLYVFSLIGNYHDAEDIVSEIFLEYIKYRPGKSINFSDAKDECEFKSKIYTYNIGTKSENCCLVAKDPLDIMLEDELRHILEDRIIMMNKKYSRVLELYYIKGMRLCEIAKVLCMKQNTVSHKVQRGKMILKNYLIKKGYR